MEKQEHLKKMYRVKAEFISRGQTPVTLVGGVSVCLGETDAVNELPATSTKPPEKRVAKKATQEQIKALFLEGHEMIEEYEG